MEKILTMAITGILLSGCSVSGIKSGNNGTTEIDREKVSEISGGKFTAETMRRMGGISDIRISPNGKKILYGVTYTNIGLNKSNRELFIINADGSSSSRLTFTSESEGNARWTKDGKNILFLRHGQIWKGSIEKRPGKKDESGIVFEIGNIVRLTDFTEPVEAFELSPKGDKMIYMSEVKYASDPADVYPDLKKANAHIVTDLMYRHWDHYVETVPHTFLTDFDENSGKIAEGKDILKDSEDPDWRHYELPLLPWNGLEQLSFSPDETHIAYSCKKLTGKQYAFSTNTDIYWYDISDGSVKNLTEEMPGYDTNPSVSPDGKYLAWLSMRRAGYESDKSRLFIMNLETGEKKELSKDYKYNVQSITWSKNSGEIYFTSLINAVQAICMSDLYGKIKRITPDSLWYDFDEVMTSGKDLVAVNNSMMRPNEIVSINASDGKVRQLTFENRDILEKLDTPKMEQRWMTTVDGKKMHTWVIYPPHFDKTKKYPAILICLGGPQSTNSQHWSTRWNYRLMASHGYIVILPNRRGTTAFGQPWCEEISGDYCGLNIQDYLTAADEMKKEPYVGKMAAVGASYGGYSIYYLAGMHKKRFAAFIAHAGIFNQEQMYMTTEEMWFPTWDNGGAPWDNNPTATRHYSHSPHKFIKNWDTPIMIVVGEKDYRVPYTQGMAAFNAARMMGVPAKMLMFPNEGHWVLKPQNCIFWNREFFAWLDKYCK
ncbi:MAG: S9 family peptidase [Bacteroidales bacterium]|jgi:dipeptidyl aminopeptidase/acylaminoacyl peptidase|nr:S9 family peptidase [Bacteroidales bacterium]